MERLSAKESFISQNTTKTQATVVTQESDETNRIISVVQIR